jgi:myo-inositol 2-dehydrogenase / D-chiro-inositol 1-dehydrogenase
MKRRTFLKTALCSVAAPTIIPSYVLGKDAPSNVLRLASIGVGRMGRGDMTNAIGAGGSGVRLVAVCDVDRKRAAHAANVVRERCGAETTVDEYQDFRELLARDDIDGVTISTPDHQHAIVAVAAAKAGKDIYLQKPLTYSIDEGKALVKAVRENNVVFQTGSQQRSSVYFRTVCELVRNERIGKLQHIEVALPTDGGTGKNIDMAIPENLAYPMWLGPTPDAPYTEHRVHPQRGYDRPGWLQINSYCHGMITGWGAHMYDIAQWGMGTDVDSGPVEIDAKGKYPDRGLFNVHVGYKAEARYANGVTMSSSNGKAGVKFIGADGWLSVKRGGFNAHDRNILREKIGEDGVQLYRSRNHMGNFLDCMRTRKETICPVEVGHRSNTVCILHHISMKLGRKLAWDPKTEQIVGDEEANAMLDYPHRKGWEVWGN